VTLLHTWRPHFVPLVTWYPKRARHHTVAATHAAFLRIDNRTRCGFPESTDRTHGHTGGILTVHAEPSNVDTTVRLHHVQSMGGKFFLAGVVHPEVGVRSKCLQAIRGQRVTTVGPQQSVHKLARDNAALAANTARSIDQDCFAHCSVVSIRKWGEFRKGAAAPAEFISTRYAANFSRKQG